MTYKELYESAVDKLEKSKITLGEFEKMIEPLNAEIATADSDTISRQTAIKATWQDAGYTDPFNVMTAIRDRIQQLPPAQPEIVTCDRCVASASGTMQAQRIAVLGR